MTSLWGANPTPAGTRFALWAPAAKQVSLQLQVRERRSSYPMARDDDGWWRITSEQAPPGILYRFEVDALQVPDPASRHQPRDCHGPSEVIDPQAYPWRCDQWRGRPRREAVIYELHVGAFTRQGTFAAAAEQLDVLAELGVSAIELMPVSDFPGARNWGYDGVLPFAPDSRYGRPDDLKALIDRAHELELMVLLDVVYNHFGPDGNYFGGYAPELYNPEHHTPWGDGLNFDRGEASRWVRRFFIDNALFWLEEYRFDGLRLDAVHSIVDDSEPHLLADLARAVDHGPGAHRHVHLIVENDANEARWLAGEAIEAQWNDDFHHAMHVVLTGETDSYYEDYADAPRALLGRALAEGFAYQGEVSRHREGRRRGEPTSDLPPLAFVNFLQNHDQIGNRALGERLHELCDPEALAVATTITLLAPSPPMLFMGQEWAASAPFNYFCDFSDELAAAVREGRRREFERFPAFTDPTLAARIADPGAADTFERSILDWSERSRPDHAVIWQAHQRLLALRARHLIPLLEPDAHGAAHWDLADGHLLRVQWTLRGGVLYSLLANLGGEPRSVAAPPGQRLIATHGDWQQIARGDQNAINPADPLLARWSALFVLDLGAAA